MIDDYDSVKPDKMVEGLRNIEKVPFLEKMMQINESEHEIRESLDHSHSSEERACAKKIVK